MDKAQLEAKKVGELREIASMVGVPTATKLKKDDLIAAIIKQGNGGALKSPAPLAPESPPAPSASSESHASVEGGMQASAEASIDAVPPVSQAAPQAPIPQLAATEVPAIEAAAAPAIKDTPLASSPEGSSASPSERPGQQGQPGRAGDEGQQRHRRGGPQRQGERQGERGGGREQAGGRRNRGRNRGENRGERQPQQQH